MTFEERKAEILAEQAKAGKSVFLRPHKGRDGTGPDSQGYAAARKPEKCRYAQDTGEVAFQAAPCRGNRIICQHPQNTGFVSYGRQCRREKCVFFDAE